MAANRMGAWVFGLGLAAVLPLSAFADEPNLGLAPPDAPPAFVLTDGAQDQPPAPAVAAAPPAAVPTPVVADVAPPDLPAAPVTLTLGDRLASVIEARLGDPKLPLPPKLTKQAREDLAAFYRASGFKPLWIADESWGRAALSVLARLERAGEDGLDPADYPVPSLKAGASPLTDAEFAEAELKLSAAAFLYARDARGGRIDPIRISGLITPKLDLPTLPKVMAALAGHDDPGAVLEGFNPRYPGYEALRSKLAEIRANRPDTPVARSGRPGLDVADLGHPPARLPAASGRLEGDILANMERWRWLPATVPARSVNVNVPEFRLRVVEDGRVVHETRVITGRPQTPTPIFSGLMEYAIVNPSWFIPPSILKKEILPGLAKDPNYAARRGYQVVRRGSAVSVRQPPGAGNALGYIKFMFPNDHAVYLHDTPSRGLFASGMRAFSHGCVRVENPFALGGRIIGGTWTEARLKSLIGYGERMINLAEKLPVNLTYFTVSVDEAGTLRTFDDVYGYNRRIRVALGLGA